jgi:hypothetical protein
MTELEFLRKQVREEMRVITETLAAGKAKDFADYREMCGVARGLQIAHNLIAEMAERIENSDE